MNILSEDIRLSYDSAEILKGASVRAADREFVGLIGPNGSGKSTLLKCIYRVLRPDVGCVYLDGEPLSGLS